MANRKDEMKGRAKEAAGDLTDNGKLRRSGKIDRAAAATKEKVRKAGRRVSLEGTAEDIAEGIDTIKDKAQNINERMSERPDADEDFGDDEM